MSKKKKKTQMPVMTNLQVNAARNALARLGGVKWQQIRTIVRFAVLIDAVNHYAEKVLIKAEDKLKADHGVAPEDDQTKNEDYMKAWHEVLAEKSELKFDTPIPEEWLSDFRDDGPPPSPSDIAALLPFIALSDCGGD